MSSNTFLILLVLLNLFLIHSAYRIDSNNEALFSNYNGKVNDEEYLDNFKTTEENPLDNYYIIPCHGKSSHILCNKLDHLSRRDTGFLRFGRK
ncbi:unnamed protein product [Adineta steineri]|uniref:Uncharacterized protein n=1 Tax=Adineta steineri TaxID=433720 RepID=A0A814D8T6_9BILA|nr:unnamed protein product [Adineta steineri]CAF4006817.1 unnamed protein product [Adineta steineri]